MWKASSKLFLIAGWARLSVCSKAKARKYAVKSEYDESTTNYELLKSIVLDVFDLCLSVKIPIENRDVRQFICPESPYVLKPRLRARAI